MTLEHISYRDFILATCVAFSVRLSWFMHIASTHIVLMPLQGRKNRSIELQFFVCSSTSQYGHIDWLARHAVSIFSTPGVRGTFVFWVLIVGIRFQGNMDGIIWVWNSREIDQSELI
jgi:hypothetical protein